MCLDHNDGMFVRPLASFFNVIATHCYGTAGGYSTINKIVLLLGLRCQCF
jgi:hypothetical protein